MKILRSLCLLYLLLQPINSYATVISDVISFNKVLPVDGYNLEFNIAEQGYNYLTDTINWVTISYDFTNMIDEFDDIEDMSTLESLQINSYIFDGRTYFNDINPGVYKVREAWNKNLNYCQLENDGVCELNLDKDGMAREILSIYSSNIWVGDVTFSVDVTRTEVPEPSTLILFFLGLSTLFVGRKLQRA
jgi:hypothetical protein